MRRLLALALVALALGAPMAGAHGGGSTLPGDTLARAKELGAPPARVFDELVANEPHYYRVTLTEGAPLRVVAPDGAAPAGEVWVYVLGADLPNGTLLPANVERPEGWGALVFLADDAGQHLDARLPARYAELLEREVAPGERVVVLVSEVPARLGILVDAPGIAWQDLALMPSLRGDVRAWSGAPTWLAWVVGPVGALAAVAVLARRRGEPWPLAALLGAFAAATFGASTALLVVDATRAAHAPWLLVAAGVALAVASVWAARARGPPTWKVRAVLLACGILGIVTWHGLLWGPVAAIAGALLPEPEAKAKD